MTQPERLWRGLLPEPLWKSLIGLLALAILTASPPVIIFRLLWPDASGTAILLVVAGSYLAAIPVTLWLLQPKKR